MAIDHEPEYFIRERHLLEASEPDGWREALKRIENARESRRASLELPDLNLTSLPQEVATLRELKVLELTNNRFTAFPPTLRKLPDLQTLYLNGNEIREIPEWISRLPNLVFVDLSDNRISTIPSSVAQMPKLEIIELRGNPLPEELVAAAAKGAAGLFRYLELAAKSGMNPRTVKVVFLGEPKSGKTTLLEALALQCIDGCSSGRPDKSDAAL